MLEAGASERMAAKKAGVSRETVRAINKCKTLDMEVVDRIKKGLAAKFYDVADRSLDNISDSKLEHAQPSQLIMTAGIATDKARLIEGKATSRTEYVDATDKQIQEEIAALEKELQDLGATGEILEAAALEDASNRDPNDTQAIVLQDQGVDPKRGGLQINTNQHSPTENER
jgi:hypothetical protein